MSLPNIPLADELAQVREDRRRLETREAELKALLIANPDARAGKHWLAEVKRVPTRRTDLTELRAAAPELVAEHTHSVTETRVELSGITEDGEIVTAREMRIRRATTNNRSDT